MNLQIAVEYAAEHFPNQPIHEFGRLIQFRYYNNPNLERVAIVEDVYADHVQTICLIRHQEKPDDCSRSFYFSRIIDNIQTDSQSLDCRSYYEQFVKTHYPNRHFGYQMIDGRRVNEDKPQIYFTGFPAAEKKQLEAIAAEKGFWVTSDMTKQMAYLVCGARAGAKKIQKAEKMETVITDKDGFMMLIKSGEIIRI